jgi:hypothetical protein
MKKPPHHPRTFNHPGSPPNQKYFHRLFPINSTNYRFTNATNLSGTSVEGGTPRRIAKGDYIFVPENTPHSFTKTQGRLVIMSIHVPRPPSAG